MASVLLTTLVSFAAVVHNPDALVRVSRLPNVLDEIHACFACLFNLLLTHGIGCKEQSFKESDSKIMVLSKLAQEQEEEARET